MPRAYLTRPPVPKPSWPGPDSPVHTNPTGRANLTNHAPPVPEPAWAEPASPTTTIQAGRSAPCHVADGPVRPASPCQPSRRSICHAEPHRGPSWPDPASPASPDLTVTMDRQSRPVHTLTRLALR